MSHWVNSGFMDQNLILLCSCNDYIGSIEDKSTVEWVHKPTYKLEGLQGKYQQTSW